MDVENLEHGVLDRVRAVDRFLIARQRDGTLPSYSAYSGEETAIVGAVAAMAPCDWVFPSAREFLCAALVRGAPLATLFRQVLGRVGDPAKGRQPPGAGSMKSARIASVSVITGAHLPHATGAAWAARTQRRGDAVLCLFGEGATSTGDFHNALNFAGVFKAPIVFVCRNNGRAASTPAFRQTKTATFAEKAVAYGLESVVIEGADVNVVRNAVAAARASALRGDRATLIEVLTTPAEDTSAASDVIAREIDVAWADAQAAGSPPREWLFDDVFATESEQRS